MTRGATRRSPVPTVLLAVASGCALAGGACGDLVQLGVVEGRSEDADGPTEPPTPCDGAACGSPCELALGLPGFCDGLGTCTAELSCYWACAGKTCGEPCSLCSPDGTGDCTTPPQETFCDAFGDCHPGPAGCASWDPCVGAACGTPCSPCDPGDFGCTEPAELFVCDAFGSCASANEVKCDPCFDPNYGPKLCGEPCDPNCQPWEVECPDPYELSLCDGAGTCSAPEDIYDCPVGFEPCPAEAQCGDPCTVCDPDMETCAPMSGLFCTGPLGGCVDELPSCPELDCTGMPCGMQCGFCPPEDPYCSPEFCDPTLGCTIADFVVCPGPDPCEGKLCGEPCLLCDPQYATCDEQGVFLVCAGDGFGCTDYASNYCPASGQSYQPCAGKKCGEPCSDECDPYDTANCMPSIVESCDPLGQCVENADACP